MALTAEASPFHRHKPNQSALDEVRIEAFKQNILERMGLTHEPQTERHLNTTLDEKRQALRLYRRSVDELKGRIHDLYEDEDKNLLAKQYHNIRASGELFIYLSFIQSFIHSFIRIIRSYLSVKLGLKG